MFGQIHQWILQTQRTSEKCFINISGTRGNHSQIPFLKFGSIWVIKMCPYLLNSLQKPHSLLQMEWTPGVVISVIAGSLERTRNHSNLEMTYLSIMRLAKYNDIKLKSNPPKGEAENDLNFEHSVECMFT